MKEFTTVFQGESRSIQVRVQDRDGVPFDLTDVTEIQVRFRKADPQLGQALIKSISDDPPFSGGVSILAPLAGRIFIELEPADTIQLKTGERQDFTVFLYKGLRASVNLTGAVVQSRNPGTYLNGLQLSFDGIKDVETVVEEYNDTVNIDQEVYITGNEALVPPSGIATLSGGTDVGNRVINFTRAITVGKPSV